MVSVWYCAYCGQSVPYIVTKDGDLEPMTNYWNVEHDMVFCSAICSFNMHELNYVKKDDDDG